MDRIEELEKRVNDLEKQETILRAKLEVYEKLTPTMISGGMVAIKKSKARFGTNHEAKRTLDTETGVVYDSETKAGIALGPTYGFPAESKSYYKIKALHPEKFQHLAEGEEVVAVNETEQAPA